MRLRKNDKILITVMLILVTVSVSSTSMFFLLGGNVGTTALSEVNTTKVFVTPPNMTGIDNVLDSIKAPSGTQKLVISVNSILFDSDQKQYPLTTYEKLSPVITSLIGYDLLPSFVSTGFVKPLSLTDQSGHILDLGTVQVSFTALTDSDQQISVTGKMRAYLDDKVVSEKTIYAQGIAVNKKIDLLLDNKNAFTFTFSDEGKDWIDKSTHIFKVTLVGLTATTTTGTTSVSYSSGVNEFLAYLLPMTLDGSKKTILGVDNKAVSIFISDDTIQSCGLTQSVSISNSPIGTSNPYTIISKSGGHDAPAVTVVQNGFTVAKLDGMSSSVSVSPDGAVSSRPPSSGFCTGKVTGIPRDAIVVFTFEGNSYTVHTPTTHYDYVVDCSGRKSTDPSHATGQYVSTGCKSNFGN